MIINIAMSFLFFILESLAQEIELERKTRSAGGDREVKSPLAERQAAAAYYKNSVLFGSAN